ncbi:MAG: glycerophosphodiester phosphodiesterase [Cytophagaceae bacterium]|nr:glycerophosphodiester phosphodiesterase [Cytophagaceae bacterium]
MAQTQRLDIQGHRGCRGLMPENSIPAFLKALDLGVTTLELDVCISADKQVVVSHEPYFNAAFTTKPDGSPVAKSEEKTLNLYRMPYSEIKKYDTGQRGNVGFPEQQKLPAHKPLLREVIEAAEAQAQKTGRAKPRYNIEIKSEEKEYDVSQPPVAGFCDLVYAEISALLPTDRVTVQSFDFNVLKHWKQKTDAGQYKKIALAALVNTQGPDGAVKALGFRPDIFSPYHILLSRGKVDTAHKLGMKVVPWTVNDTENMQKLVDWGVDGIITDYPDRAKTLR